MRELLETLNGVDIYQGPCENCGIVTRIAFDGTRYLCVNCLKTLKSKSVRALDDVKAKKKREALDRRIRTLKSELSEARKDLNFLKKNYLKSRATIWSKQDRVSKLDQEIRKMTAKLHEPPSTKKNKWRAKFGDLARSSGSASKALAALNI